MSEFTTIAVLVLDDLSAFEYGVACEVFGIDRTAAGVPALTFRVCGVEAGRPVSTEGGAGLVPPYALDGLRDADLVMVCPGELPDGPDRERVLDALRDAHATGSTMLSMCTGAFLLAEAGLLEGRTCATHWEHAQELRERFPGTTVDDGVLYVDDDDIVTTAGNAAGIDACLHLVRQRLGSDVANAIARRMVVPAQREGDQRQYIDSPVAPCSEESLSTVMQWMQEHLGDEQSVAALAARASMSQRTFARRFIQETGTTPMRWLAAQRVLQARALLETSDLAMDAIAGRTGFGTAALLRHHFRRATGVPPSDYRRTFAH